MKQRARKARATVISRRELILPCDWCGMLPPAVRPLALPWLGLLIACTSSGTGGPENEPTSTSSGPATAGPMTNGSSSAPPATTTPGNQSGAQGGAANAGGSTMSGASGTSTLPSSGAGGSSPSEPSATPGAMAGEGGASGGSFAGASSGGDSAVAPIQGDDFVEDVEVSVHPEVSTLLVVTWTQVMEADEVALEFSFDGTVMTSRPSPGTLGEHRDVVLGVPGETDVTIRVVSRVADASHPSSEYQETTEAVPAGMPRPEVLAFDEALASPERFMLGAVENSDGGCGNQNCYYHTTFWVYIMDRQGRIVWYYADPASNATSSFQRVARDGEYLWIEKRPFSGNASRGVLKMTLDWEYFEEVDVENLADCIDVTDHGSLLYDDVQTNELMEMSRDGEVRSIWSCRDHFGRGFECYSNTINWNPDDDTVMMSFPYETTAIQIARETGEVVGQYGSAPGSYAFSPDTWEFGFQHFPNITAQGTLIVSSHMPGYGDTFEPVAGQHAFMEFEIDRENETLVEHWVYDEGEEWAMFKGMAIRLPGGNTLGNYGTGGVIREITPDKETAFHVKFDVEDGDDFFNKMVGHNVLIDDLYALNGGGPEATDE